LSEKSTGGISQALALAGVKGPHKPFDPKGRAFQFGSPVKGSCGLFQKLRLRLVVIKSIASRLFSPCSTGARRQPETAYFIAGDLSL
jgi:hypothetical protein